MSLFEKMFNTLLEFPLLYPWKRCKDIITQEQRPTLAKCQDSITGRVVVVWARVMVLPQFFIAPIFAMLGYPWCAAIFFTRTASIIVVGEINKRFPYQRIAGLCHLTTFGPLLTWMILDGNVIPASPTAAWNTMTMSSSSTSSTTLDTIYNYFVLFEVCVISICLYLDSKDLFFFVGGQPYACYIREATKKKKLHIDDPRALEPVTWWSRLVGP